MIGHCIVQHTSKIVGYIGKSFYKNWKEEEKSIDLYIALQGADSNNSNSIVFEISNV